MWPLYSAFWILLNDGEFNFKHIGVCFNSIPKGVYKKSPFFITYAYQFCKITYNYYFCQNNAVLKSAVFTSSQVAWFFWEPLKILSHNKRQTFKLTFPYSFNIRNALKGAASLVVTVYKISTHCNDTYFFDYS